MSGSTGPMPSEKDCATILDFLEGKLDAAATDAFVERLADDPLLAQRVEDFAVMDRLQRAAMLGSAEPRRAESVRRSSVTGVWLGLAAAASIALAFGVWWWRRDPSPAATRLAVAALGIDDASPERVNDLLGLEQSWLPARMRDGQDPDEILPTDPEYLHAALPAQEARASAALAAPAPSVTAGRFAIVLRPAQDAWAVVIAVPREGRPALLFPDERYPGPDGRLAAGELAFLPRPFVAAGVADGAARADIDYGFLVPLGARELIVLTALSPRPVSAELRAGLERQLGSVAGAPSDIARAMSEWLAEENLSVGETIVIEPE